ncbi:hypothetical protein EDB83DRAFT_2429436 [Lactarius deliciosus]|nr:hypothetical protein EDB83DRAFT_2429436 [Lactarius deliciosus]
MQNIIWAFSRTPPGLADSDAPISIHHKIGRGMLSLTRIPTIPAEPSRSPLPQCTPDIPTPIPKKKMTTTTRRQKTRVKATMTMTMPSAVVLRASCMARSVPRGSCSSYRLVRSWPNMPKRREVPGHSVMHLAFPILTDRSISSPGRWEAPVSCRCTSCSA